jgi:hypothetical protein
MSASKLKQVALELQQGGSGLLADNSWHMNASLARKRGTSDGSFRTTGWQIGEKELVGQLPIAAHVKMQRQCMTQ